MAVVTGESVETLHQTNRP